MHHPPRRLFRVLALAVTTMVTAGCGQGNGAVAGDELRGRTFLSESITTGDVQRPLVEATRIRLGFSDDGRITASAGCNTMGGAFEVEGGRLVVGELSTTELGCDPERHAQDEWLARFLAAGPAYTADGDRLELRASDTVISLLDRRVADADRPLEGTVWRIDGIIDGDAVSSVPAEVTATLRFEAGRITVDIEDCNEGGTTVAIEPTAIRLGTLVMTDRACAGAPAQVEDAVVAVLAGTIGYAIEAATLTLTHAGAKGLMLRAVD